MYRKWYLAILFFSQEIGARSRPGQQASTQTKPFSFFFFFFFFFDKEADVPLARFSDWDLPESDESDDDDHGGLPDNEPDDHEGKHNPIFVEEAENQAQMASVTMMTSFWRNSDIFTRL